MDISEQYINMCDCPEIQKQRIYKCKCICDHGSFYWDKVYKKIRVDAYPGGINTSVWLPRQDQIQEMLSEKLFAGLFILDDTDVGARLSYMTGRFKDFVHTKCEKMIPLEKNRARVEYLLNSMEQLWLAFYIWEKHKKIWNREKWVNNKGEINAIPE